MPVGDGGDADDEEGGAVGVQSSPTGERLVAMPSKLTGRGVGEERSGINNVATAGEGGRR